jgi:hypothetical protein
MIDYNSDEYDSDEDTRDGSGFSLRGIVARDWPYFLMLVLALFGVAYTNFARQAMTAYWIVLAPVFGLVCVAARWRSLESSRPQVKLIVTQALHWITVVFADVSRFRRGRQTNDERFRKFAHGADRAGAGNVHGWHPCGRLAHLRHRNRAGTWRARHRLVRRKNAAYPAADPRVVRGHRGAERGTSSNR